MGGTGVNIIGIIVVILGAQKIKLIPCYTKIQKALQRKPYNEYEEFSKQIVPLFHDPQNKLGKTRASH